VTGRVRSVCLSLLPYISETACPSFTKFLLHLHCSLARRRPREDRARILAQKSACPARARQFGVGPMEFKLMYSSCTVAHGAEYAYEFRVAKRTSAAAGHFRLNYTIYTQRWSRLATTTVNIHENARVLHA